MSRRYKLICSALAVIVLPGAIPVALSAGVLYVGGRLVCAVRRVRARRQVRRIVIAAGGWRPEYRGEA